VVGDGLENVIGRLRSSPLSLSLSPCSPMVIADASAASARMSAGLI
jgi:hypothetical protein